MGSSFQFPPGFRFHPSDQELIVHYLQNKVASHPLPASIIAEIDLYKYNPWELPKNALFGEEEWYFFSPRDRKYPNGTRPNRAAASGYWKATGTDKPILASCGSSSIGVKKALVFYIGRPPKGVKTDWIMNEYRLPDTTTLITPSRLRGSMRLDDWVLCRVRQRGSMLRPRGDSSSTEMKRYLPYIDGCPINPASQNDMVTDYLYKDCRLLASILAGYSLPPSETNSSVNQDNSNKESSQITVSSFDIQPNPLKRKPSQENALNNVFASSNKIHGSNISGMSHCNQNQFQGNFTYNSPDPVIDFQELYEMAFSD